MIKIDTANTKLASIDKLENHLFDNDTSPPTVNKTVNQLHMGWGETNEIPIIISATLFSAILAQNLI